MIDRQFYAPESDALDIVCAVSPDWETQHVPTLRAGDHRVSFVSGGDALAERLALDWSIEAVVLDLALAVPALAGRFGPGGPHLIAFGEAANAGIALDAHRVDFIDAGDGAALLGALRSVAPPASGVADLSDRAAARRGAIGEEAARVAAALNRLAAAAMPAPARISANFVRQVIRARRARDRYFRSDIFGDPAWDMLLDLFAANIERASVSVTSLCIAAAVPTSTALRWIRNLCDAGIFDRRTDPTDARRAYVSLTPDSVAAMEGYFAAIDGTVAP